MVLLVLQALQHELNEQLALLVQQVLPLVQIDQLVTIVGLEHPVVSNV